MLETRAIENNFDLYCLSFAIVDVYNWVPKSTGDMLTGLLIVAFIFPTPTQTQSLPSEYQLTAQRTPLLFKLPLPYANTSCSPSYPHSPMRGELVIGRNISCSCASMQSSQKNGFSTSYIHSQQICVAACPQDAHMNCGGMFLAKRRTACFCGDLSVSAMTVIKHSVVLPKSYS